jgi:hypothetical protein
MNLLFRFLLTLLVSSFKSRLGIADISTVRFRVWPNDLDVNFHLNNGWWYIEQRFVHRDRLMAYGMIKGLFRGPDGNVRPADVLTAAGLSPISPEMPEWFARALEMEATQPLD